MCGAVGAGAGTTLLGAASLAVVLSMLVCGARPLTLQCGAPGIERVCYFTVRHHRVRGQPTPPPTSPGNRRRWQGASSMRAARPRGGHDRTSPSRTTAASYCSAPGRRSPAPRPSIGDSFKMVVSVAADVEALGYRLASDGLRIVEAWATKPGRAAGSRACGRRGRGLARQCLARLARLRPGAPVAARLLRRAWHLAGAARLMRFCAHCGRVELRGASCLCRPTKPSAPSWSDFNRQWCNLLHRGAQQRAPVVWREREVIGSGWPDGSPVCFVAWDRIICAYGPGPDADTTRHENNSRTAEGGRDVDTARRQTAGRPGRRGVAHHPRAPRSDRA